MFVLCICYLCPMFIVLYSKKIEKILCMSKIFTTFAAAKVYGQAID